jgi:ABC-type branched-subunit amino acid transport system substrate-binding protein
MMIRTLRSHVHTLLLLLLATLAAACAPWQAPAAPRPTIALLAPFEGRYRALGYDAYYAAQLAVADAAATPVDFLPMDDGGTVTTAAARAAAFAAMPRVRAVVVVGAVATDPQVLAAFGDLPVIVVGEWGISAPPPTVFRLSNPPIAARLTLPPRADSTNAPAPLIANEWWWTAEARATLPPDAALTVLSSALPPTDDFSARITASAQFAPPPHLLAMLTYDAQRLAIAAARADRAATTAALAASDYAGLNGRIRFADGVWQDAPIYEYVVSEQ